MSSKKKPSTQLELTIERAPQKDRNFSEGGRSFYFFDFDDNIAYLKTPVYLFNKSTNKEIALSSGEYARLQHLVGQHGELKEYYLLPDDPEKGSFRDFRDRTFQAGEKSSEKQQVFVRDIVEAISQHDYLWKGPSWNCFYHAVFNQRPLSIITARGHKEETLKLGIQELIRTDNLPCEPNYLSLFPVSQPEIQKRLSNGLSLSVAELKKKAIHASVEQAFTTYGENSHHRFGMSDDDPKNIELIIEAMTELKREFPKNHFFVFDSSRGRLIKRAVFEMGVIDHELSDTEQLTLFDEIDSK